MDRPIRVQLSRRKGWRMPANTVKVSRPSKWGNDVRIGDDISYYTYGCKSATPQDAVDLFRRFMEAHQAANPTAFEAFLAPLRGRNLACWCKVISHNQYVPCHADVLISIANDIPMEEVIDENTRRAKGEAL